MKLYGNKQLTKLTADMVRKGREPHSLIIHGEKGLGKKTAAKYIAAQLMCESKSGEPCGVCKSCRMLANDSHPDFYTAQANEKGNYFVDDIREQILGTAWVAPNEGDIKVYVIPDFDLSTITSVQIQNILLKLIEEPPDHAAIILTARSRETFLPTIISRCLSLGVVNVDERESRDYLQTNFPESSLQEIEEAAQAGRGNIGRCREYITKGQFFYGAELARKLAAAYSSGSEYELLKALASADGKKPLLREGIYLFSEIVRDACIIISGADTHLTGCDSEGARRLAQRLTLSSAAAVYDIIGDCVRRIDSNCNLSLTINSFCASVASSLS